LAVWEAVRLTRKFVGKNGACRLSWPDHAVRQVSSSEKKKKIFHFSIVSLTLDASPLKIDRIKVRRAMESSLQKTAMKIVAIVNRDRDHIPPITTSDQNPFPYRIAVNPKQTENVERGFGGWN
jgi:hypothetical protein